MMNIENFQETSKEVMKTIVKEATKVTACRFLLEEASCKSKLRYVKDVNLDQIAFNVQKSH